MCGIFLSISRNDYVEPKLELRERLLKRGPDCAGSLKCALKSRAGEAFYVYILATVLALRGDAVVEQPIIHDTSTPRGDRTPSKVLCWNGEAWLLDSKEVHGNDGLAVHKMLSVTESQDINTSSADVCQRIRRTLESVTGPFSFCFVDVESACIAFGRDCLGRRSLLQKTMDGGLCISSVSDGMRGWCEVDANDLCLIDIGRMNPLYFGSDHSKFNVMHCEHKSMPQLNRSLPASDLELDRDDKIVVEQFHVLLKRSLELRLNNLCTSNHATNGSVTLARLGILFSGGVDCTLLARMAHQFLPLHEPIDLLNVAFENPRVHGTRTTSAYEDCPDRITARKAVAELVATCRHRVWRLVEINVPYEELLMHRSIIQSLIYPHETEMDMSIASALYFAARGRGTISSNDFSHEHSTTARVLLSGLGADELSGGYQRHATAFARGAQHQDKYNRLLDELSLDLQRLGKRNLGRDDRVISHWAKEARYPYLDESVVEFAARLPIWNKCRFGQPSSPRDTHLSPDKFLVRHLAHRLGLVTVAMEKKRAIQFGARTAKMEKGKVNGTDVIK
ncbi:MAG: hypothetical protein M1828_006407 [Chrysothrix sp. TS-e1954]|nr:MAG: hypothetical protein M1828_006407 [Chrysothrix sp. TS-e1954]